MAEPGTSTISLDRYAADAKALVAGAQSLADEEHHREVQPLHLLMRALERDARLRDALARAGANVAELASQTERALSALPRSSEPAFLSDRMLDLLERAEREARRDRTAEVRGEHVLHALTQEIRGPAGEILGAFGIVPGALREHLSRAIAAAPADDVPPDGLLRDLLADARSSSDPLVERTVELSRLFTVLERRDKRHPLLVGERGVGKRALVALLARHLASGRVPAGLPSQALFEMDAGALVGSARMRSEVEARVKSALGQVTRRGALLVIESVNQLFAQAPVVSAATDLLRQELVGGKLVLLGTTTPEGARRLRERDPQIYHLFTQISIDEPSPGEAIAIVGGALSRYAVHHRIEIGQDAVVAAVHLGRRYLADRFLPESAFDLIDEAAAAKRVAESGAAESGTASAATIVLGEEDVARTLAARTGVPLTRLLEGESDKLLGLEARLGARVVGQDAALVAVSRAVRRGRTGLRDAERPIGSFLFLGPSGVGKTELAKALAEVVFDDERALTRLDMSEFMERHMAQRLLGAPPGYADSEQGGFLTEAVRKRPYSVLLFDEVEKAHADVFNLLLQLLDDGRLTDGRGRLADFSHTVVILTSNLGSDRILAAEPAAFEAPDARDALEQALLAGLSDFFRPELLNRLDEVIVFKPLGPTELRRIVDLEIAKLCALLTERRITLDIDDAARDRLAELGHEPALGARPLQRVISRLLHDPLAAALLAGKYPPGSTVTVRTEGSSLALS